MADKRPLLIGMNNPLSDDPDHALFPAPRGCSGERLYQMLKLADPEVSKLSYTRAFERRNLVTGKGWDINTAIAAATTMRDDLVGRRVVLVGAEVAKAFRMEPHIVHPVQEFGAVVRQIPHPSGRNRWYNQEINRVMVGLLLRELLHG